jgi:hypothetical protein
MTRRGPQESAQIVKLMYYSKNTSKNWKKVKKKKFKKQRINDARHCDSTEQQRQLTQVFASRVARS